MPHRSRRSFLANAGLLAGGAALASLPARRLIAQDPNENCSPPGTQPAPTPFTPNNNLPLRVRKSAFNLTSAEQAQLVAAYAALRALPPSDPRGWLAQAHVHCFYCSGSQDYPSNVEIHGSWTFMPWHRCYLYFHERILATLIGDDTFALPYWDWENTSNPTFPPLYAVNPSSLYDATRSGTTPSTTPNITAMFAANGVDVQARLAETSQLLFLGNSATGGNIEYGPHGDVHIWTTDPSLDISQYDPNMGILQTAARDPVFFAHHGNIDRLWWSWNGAGNPNYSDASWLGTSFNFYDENQNWISITIGDVLDSTDNLHYTYDKSAIDNTSSRVFLSSTHQQPVKQGPDPTTTTIAVPEAAQTQIAEAAPARTYILHIDGIDVPPDKAAMVRVYVNLPTASPTTSVRSPNFVGTFTIVPSVASGSKRAHVHKKRNVVFNLSRQIAGVLRGQKNLTVTLVPVNRLTRRHENIELTYDKVYVTTE